MCTSQGCWSNMILQDFTLALFKVTKHFKAKNFKEDNLKSFFLVEGTKSAQGILWEDFKQCRVISKMKEFTFEYLNTRECRHLKIYTTL